MLKVKNNAEKQLLISWAVAATLLAIGYLLKYAN